jgi:hypothetical protein
MLKVITLRVIMLSVIMLCVIMLSVIKLSVIMLCAIMLNAMSVIKLTVVALLYHFFIITSHTDNFLKHFILHSEVPTIAKVVLSSNSMHQARQPI